MKKEKKSKSTPEVKEKKSEITKEKTKMILDDKDDKIVSKATENKPSIDGNHDNHTEIDLSKSPSLKSAESSPTVTSPSVTSPTITSPPVMKSSTSMNTFVTNTTSNSRTSPSLVSYFGNPRSSSPGRFRVVDPNSENKSRTSSGTFERINSDGNLGRSRTTSGRFEKVNDSPCDSMNGRIDNEKIMGNSINLAVASINKVKAEKEKKNDGTVPYEQSVVSTNHTPGATLLSQTENNKMAEKNKSKENEQNVTVVHANVSTVDVTRTTHTNISIGTVDIEKEKERIKGKEMEMVGGQRTDQFLSEERTNVHDVVSTDVASGPIEGNEKGPSIR